MAPSRTTRRDRLTVGSSITEAAQARSRSAIIAATAKQIRDSFFGTASLNSHPTDHLSSSLFNCLNLSKPDLIHINGPV
jgi:hypothetical protein